MEKKMGPERRYPLQQLHCWPLLWYSHRKGHFMWSYKAPELMVFPPLPCRQGTPHKQNNIFTAVLSPNLIWFSKSGPDISSAYRLRSPHDYMDSVHKIQCIMQTVNKKRSAQFYLLHTPEGLIPVQLPGKGRWRLHPFCSLCRMLLMFMLLLLYFQHPWKIFYPALVLWYLRHICIFPESYVHVFCFFLPCKRLLHFFYV